MRTQTVAKENRVLKAAMSNRKYCHASTKGKVLQAPGEYVDVGSMRLHGVPLRHAVLDEGPMALHAERKSFVLNST
jgi:hypothetical protein